MRFSATTDQQLFAKTVRDLLDKECSRDALRAAWDTEGGRVPGLWSRLAELGVTGMAVPEEYDGLGLDAVDVVAVLEETGRVALPEPLLGTVVGTRLLTGAGGALAAEWLPRVAAGEAVLAVGLGPGTLVADAQEADLLLLARDGQVHAVAREDATVEAQPGVDRGIRLARVSWEAGAATAVPDVDTAAAFDLGVLAAAAQLLGLGAAMLELSVTYAGQREQFGRPIGSFQAVKHQLADVYVAVEFAHPVVSRAAWSVAHELPTRARDVSHAKHAAGEAARKAARVALQVHGGIGYTFEHDLHMWLKRTWTLASLWGDERWHLARVAAALAADQPRVP
jgi:alkylation response protein AidB-like acyl-CoA dehydrogenase